MYTSLNDKGNFLVHATKKLMSTQGFKKFMFLRFKEH